jgi:hypothetical protein
MKVFVSHKNEDSDKAAVVASTLRRAGHEVYLDIVDTNILKNGDDLGDYLRQKLSECDSLIAVISAATKSSWWVPWEIGVATEKSYPLSTYLSDASDPPDYLKKWPLLRTIAHLEQFAALAKELQGKLERSVRLAEAKSMSDARQLKTPDFHRELKRAIGQST